MTRQELIARAAVEMDRWGITQLGWTFCFDRAVRRFGQCRYRSRQIGVSMFHVDQNPDDLVVDTLLHEIAHALAGQEGHYGHGRVWKQKCLLVGAKPLRCGKPASASCKRAKWVAECTCGQPHTKHRVDPEPVLWVTGHIDEWFQGYTCRLTKNLLTFKKQY